MPFKFLKKYCKSHFFQEIKNFVLPYFFQKFQNTNVVSKIIGSNRERSRKATCGHKMNG